MSFMLYSRAALGTALTEVLSERVVISAEFELSIIPLSFLLINYKKYLFHA